MIPSKTVLLTLRVGLAALLLVSTEIVKPASAQDGTPPSPDTLQARPLRILMVALGQDMSRISDGIWHEDYVMIQDGARAIADHPRITPDEMAAIKAALGERFESFVHFDRVVHATADEMAEAAARHNMGRILEESVKLQRNCVSCHAVFRKEVREALY